MTKARAYFHEEYIDQVLVEIIEAGILHPTNSMETFRSFEPRVRSVEPSDKLFRVTSIISRLSEFLSYTNLSNFSSLMSENKVLGNEDIEAIDSKLVEVEEAYSAIEEDLDVSERKKRISEIMKKYGEKIVYWNHQLQLTRLVEETKSKAARTDKVLIIEGWIPTNKRKVFTEAVEKGAEGYSVTLFLDPVNEATKKCRIGEMQNSDNGHGPNRYPHMPECFETPPSKINNPKIAYVYEKIVTGFGLPNYFEVDPTIFMVISFPVIFGLMFGDVGHGLLLLFFSVLLYFINKKGVETSELFEYMLRGSPLLIMCSIAAIFFGFLYGELFGSELYFHIFDHNIQEIFGLSILEIVEVSSHTLESVLSEIAGFSIPVPFPFSPFENPMLLLLISLYVAIIQITFGLILGLINEIRKGNIREAILGPGLWLWFYLSCAYLFLRFKSQLLTVVFQRADILAIYIILPALVMIVARTAIHGMDGFGHALESLISSLSNSISYGRILALALTHGAFSKLLLMFLELEGIVMTIIGFIMWAFFTFLLILCFEGLLSFIQTLRLHWVEWFLKFYSGDGFEYKPLAI
jgi:V/A-type H+-transporting ATPase subunit I